MTMTPPDCLEECSSRGIPSKISEDRLCRVCSDRSDGAHFGIDSCRACAAFFRRSVVTGKKYVCRQGGNDCEINKSIRCMCRKCRLRKCLEAGMLPENVQNKRDPIIPKRNDPDAPAVSSSDTELMRSTHSAFSVVAHTSPQAYVPREVATIVERPHLLYRIIDQYKILCSVRKATEISMDPELMKSIFNTDGPVPGLSCTTTIKVSAFYRAHVPAIGDFASNTFEEFSLLDQDEKWKLFQSFVVIMWGMDSSYLTYRRVPPEQFSCVSVLSETTYLDLSRLEDFVIDSSNSKLSKEELVRLLHQCMGRPRQKMVTMMHEMQITEEEYAALLGLMLFNQNVEGGTERMEVVSKQMRAKIFEQLHHYYLMINLPNYAQRLGELMCLYSAILQSLTRMRENLELMKLLDAFGQKSFLNDIMHYKF